MSKPLHEAVENPMPDPDDIPDSPSTLPPDDERDHPMLCFCVRCLGYPEES